MSGDPLGIKDRMAQLKREEGKPVCKGRWYRGTEEMYVGAGGRIVSKWVMMPLKRQSCKGCDQCGWMDDAIREDAAEKMVHFPRHIQDFGLYKLEAVNCDDEGCDFEFILVKRGK